MSVCDWDHCSSSSFFQLYQYFFNSVSMPLLGKLAQNGGSTKCVVCEQQVPPVKLVNHLRNEHELTLVTTCAQCYYQPDEHTASMYSDLGSEDPVIKVEPRSGDTFKHARIVHNNQVCVFPFNNLCINFDIFE